MDVLNAEEPAPPSAVSKVLTSISQVFVYIVCQWKSCVYIIADIWIETKLHIHIYRKSSNKPPFLLTAPLITAPFINKDAQDDNFVDVVWNF